MKKAISDLSPLNTVCSTLVSVQLCLSIWFRFCSIKFNRCWHFETLDYWLKVASTVALSRVLPCFLLANNGKGNFSIFVYSLLFLEISPYPFVRQRKRKRGEVLCGAFHLYVMRLSEVAKNCSISANSYRSLEEPVWDWLTFWNSFVLACTAVPANNTVLLSTQMLWQIAASCVATAWHNDWCYKAVAGGLGFFCSFCTKSLFFAVALEHDKQYCSFFW